MARGAASAEDHLRRHFGVDEATYKELFEQADVDGNGKLHPLREMHTLVGLLMQRGNWTPPAFAGNDENGDGQVAGKELLDAATHLKRRFGVNDTEYQALLRDADGDGDEHLSPSEFKTLLGSLAMVGDERHHHGGPGHTHGPAPSGGEPQGGQEDHLRRHFGVDEATYKELFKQADADGNGKLHPLREMHTLVGLLMQRGNWTPPAFAGNDENGDGQVAGKELLDAATHLKRRFGVNDTEYQALLRDADEDGDEHLSPSEFKTLLGSLAMVGDERHHHGGPGHHHGPAPGGGEPQGAQEDHLRRHFGVDEATYKELFEQADADGNGKLHPLTEVHTLVGLLMQRGNWTPPGFAGNDENGDGQVAGKELLDAATHLKRRFGVNDTEYQALLRDADGDGDEHLSPSEFKTLLGSLAMVGAGEARLQGLREGGDQTRRQNFGVDERGHFGGHFVVDEAAMMGQLPRAQAQAQASVTGQGLHHGPAAGGPGPAAGGPGPATRALPGGPRGAPPDAEAAMMGELQAAMMADGDPGVARGPAAAPGPGHHRGQAAGGPSPARAAPTGPRDAPLD